MSKIRYLVGKGNNRKLKRNVPKRLRDEAGKTAWVERLRAFDAKSIKRQASNFTQHTESEISRLERMLKSRSSVKPANPGSLGLTHQIADEIALSYFADQNRIRIATRGYTIPVDHPDRDEVLEDATLQAQEAHRALLGEETTAPFRAVDIMLELGLIDAKTAENHSADGRVKELHDDHVFQYLCRRIEQADMAVAERYYASVISDGLAPVTDPFFRDAEAVNINTKEYPNRSEEASKTVANLHTLFFDAKEQEVSSSRLSQFLVPFRVLSEEIGDSTPIAEIDRSTCRDLVALLPKIPAYLTQHYRGLTIKDAIKRHVSKNGSSPKRYEEARKQLQILNSAFRLALNEGWINSNPWEGLTIKVPIRDRKKHAETEGGYEPFTIEQLNSFFSLPLFVGCQNDEHGCHKPGDRIVKRHRYWAPIIALWSGMRMNEILQLEKEDIQHSSEDIAFFDVNDTEHQNYDGGTFTKRLKTRQAVRRIPVHPKLEQLGFLKWVSDAPAGRLFPEATCPPGKKPSDVYSKRFASNLRKAGVWKSRRLVFHSFRNNFNDAMREADIPVEIREVINGWSSRNIMDARYGEGFSIERLFAEISKTEYVGLKINHLFPR